MLRCTTARAGRSDHDTHLSWGGVNTASFCASQSTPPGVESNSRWDEDRPHAGSDETFCSLRKVAAARARGARRPSGAEEGVCGEQAEPQTARREPAPARSWRLPRAWPGGARAACDRRGRVSLLPPPSLHPRSARRRAVVGEGPPPPPAETSSRLEMVLLCPFGMSHVWAREVEGGSCRW